MVFGFFTTMVLSSKPMNMSFVTTSSCNLVAQKSLFSPWNFVGGAEFSCGRCAVMVLVRPSTIGNLCSTKIKEPDMGWGPCCSDISWCLNLKVLISASFDIHLAPIGGSRFMYTTTYQFVF